MSLEVQIPKVVAERMMAIIGSEDWQKGMVPYLSALREKARTGLEDVEAGNLVAVAKLQSDAQRLKRLINLKETDILGSVSQ